MKIHHNISIKPYNTFSINVNAKSFAVFHSLEELEEIAELGPLLVLGGGSNILFTRNYDGLIAKNELTGIQLVKEDTENYYVRAAAGENWHRFVRTCLDAGYAGLENLSLIPGSVGASPIQNIGAYGVEIKDVFDSLEAYDLHDKRVVHFSHADCAFGYRDSIFKQEHQNRFVILAVTYRLPKKPIFHTSYGAIGQELGKMGVTEVSARAISAAVINIRSSKLPDPAQIGNAGSFFKNPVIGTDVFKQIKQTVPNAPGYPAGQNQTKVPAGWLIEQCGWKGYRKGDAGCYEKQALVLVNYGNATGSEIYALSTEIIASVQTKFNVTLEREVNIIPLPNP